MSNFQQKIIKCAKKQEIIIYDSYTKKKYRHKKLHVKSDQMLIKQRLKRAIITMFDMMGRGEGRGHGNKKDGGMKLTLLP